MLPAETQPAGYKAGLRRPRSSETRASQLARDLRDLGELQAARDLDEDTLDRSRRVMGEDHPCTLIFASQLARDLRDLGQAE